MQSALFIQARVGNQIAADDHIRRTDQEIMELGFVGRMIVRRLPTLRVANLGVANTISSINNDMLASKLDFRMVATAASAMEKVW